MQHSPMGAGVRPITSVGNGRRKCRVAGIVGRSGMFGRICSNYHRIAAGARVRNAGGRQEKYNVTYSSNR